MQLTLIYDLQELSKHVSRFCGRQRDADLVRRFRGTTLMQKGREQLVNYQCDIETTFTR